MSAFIAPDCPAQAGLFPETSPVLPQHVIRRDGNKVPFEEERIASALTRAAAASGEFDHHEVRLLTARALKVIRHRHDGVAPTVEQIQDIVEQVLVAANNQPARLFIGDETVLVTGVTSESSTGTTGATHNWITPQTEKRDVGQTLTILPRINGDRSVSLTIDQDNSSVKKSGSAIPVSVGSEENPRVINYPIDTVTTASLQVTAHAQDGLSVAIGGMINQINNDQVEKVPLLGDLPLLGTLFRKTARGNLRSQLILIVTPFILDSPERANLIADEKGNELRVLRDKAKPPKRLPWAGDIPLPPDTLLSPFMSDSAIPVIDDPQPAVPDSPAATETTPVFFETLPR